MFDGDVRELDTAELLSSTAEHHAEHRRLEVRLIVHALRYADLHHSTTHERDETPGSERAIVLGGAGCPSISEFAAAEFGAMMDMSAGAAAAFIGQALALRHRLPRILAMVLNEEATPWKARQIATACLDLSEEAAAIVDRRVAGIIDSVTPLRLKKIVKAAIWQADAAAAEAASQQKARERGVYIGRSNDHGNKSVWILAASGDVIRFDATVDAIAEALKALGDTSSLQRRRAKAVGILADPTYAAAVLAQASSLSVSTPPRPAAPTSRDFGGPAEAESPAVDPPEPGVDDEADRDAPHPGQSELPDPLDTPVRTRHEACEDCDDSEPDRAAQRALAARLAQIKQQAHSNTMQSGGRSPGRTEVLVHLTDHTLATGSGVLRVEGIGPMVAGQLGELIGYGPYLVRPVIDLNDKVSVDAYEIPDRIRERVALTHPVEQFPFGTAETTRRIDLDHIEPYDPTGPPGQTNSSNLAPLRRFSHRVKTHGRWSVRRLDDGALEWASPHGFRFRVDHTGTRRIDKLMAGSTSGAGG
ncbi:hypothetical protein EV644_13326 [Kribbella orskensis]|uniref:DUF222 domain-containing protein n=1 Tax=Kribbella orskensis TaxID=2512216 RepID=A0ABY2B7M3_9ACTN|nr:MULTISPECIES: hypothetical protein [Kribbella]TCN30489.1 hypothetical protein EV642_13526 [Kribbella sp. VKM Ac-2500]TCO11131.1 hypothetical protein EV644_13326 [Kribbella orskensis]